MANSNDGFDELLREFVARKRQAQRLRSGISNNSTPAPLSMNPGDLVKYKEEHNDAAPAGMQDEIFTIQCIHGSSAFLLPPTANYGGERCSHSNEWTVPLDRLLLFKRKEALVAKSKNIKVDMSQLDKVSLKDDARKEIVAMLVMGSKRSMIFDDWGLSETIEYGKGITALFWGPPGTGKTWAAHCIAKSVGKELFTLAVGQIQSSMAGETNKNIEKAFKFAKDEDKVLLLDEVDSFIGDRKNLGMILGSEINTLLTEIEKFEGLLILTTNQIGHLDPALERRISLILEFKNPTKEERMDIWKMLLPKKFPLHKDVTIEALAEHKLTGGFIKNTLLHAARLAASEDVKKVQMSHFEAAIKRISESQGKMGTRGMIGVTDYRIGGSE